MQTSAGRKVGTVLMCAPAHFAVTYKINPWMAPGHWEQDKAALLDRAQRGWAALRQSYEDHGARVLLMPSRDGLPDMVFTANAAVVLDGTALLPRFRFAERQGEEQHIQRQFETLRAAGEIVRVEQMPQGVFFEGAGDAVWDGARDLFWFGFGHRSNKEAQATLERVFGKPVLALELADPRYYHLDTCLAALSGGEIFHYPHAFTEEGRARIAETAGARNLIAASDDDAALFAVNCFELPGKHLFMGPCSNALDATLAARGYTVHHFPLEPFTLSGGSACCLTLNLARASAQAKV